MRNYKATIVIHNEIREDLRRIGRKNQTYDDIIRKLIEQNKNNDSQSSDQLRESRRL